MQEKALGQLYHVFVCLVMVAGFIASRQAKEVGHPHRNHVYASIMFGLRRLVRMANKLPLQLRFTLHL